MRAKLLTYQQKCEIINALVPQGKMTAEEAKIYILREFGLPENEIRLPFSIVSRRVGKRGLVVLQTFRRIEKIGKAAFEEAIRSMIRIETTEGVPEEEARLYFGVTLQFGSEARTQDDEVQKRVVMGTWEEAA